MSYLMYALVIAATRGEFVGKKEEVPAAAVVKTEQLPRGGIPLRGTHAPPWTAFVILQAIMLIVVWRYSALPFKASMLAIRANVIRSRNIDESWTVMKKAGEIPTPYLDEQTFLLSRDLIAMADAGQLANQPRWREMYDYTKRISEIVAAEHPKNTYSHFIYARLVQGILPLIPPAEQGPEIDLAEREFKASIETSPQRQQLYYGLARLYSMVGRREDSYATLKQALEFNKNIGESWWYVGVTAWFDLGRPEEGAPAMLEAFKARSPYVLRSVRDAFFLAQAAEHENDQDTLKKIVPLLPSLPGGSTQMYLDLARVMERTGLLQERNQILNALQQIDPSVASKLEALKNGTATSIDASIDQTPVQIEINPESEKPPATTTASASAPVPVTSAGQGGSKGPRR